jgi:hypothetical protein
MKKDFQFVLMIFINCCFQFVYNDYIYELILVTFGFILVFVGADGFIVGWIRNMLLNVVLMLGNLLIGLSIIKI